MDNALAVNQNRDAIECPEHNVREVIEAGVIQNFKCTYEICWKCMVRWISINLSQQEASPRTKRDIFRTTARIGLIQSPKLWFSFADAWNMISHTYDKKKAETVLNLAPSLLKEASDFYTILERLNAQS